MMDTEHCNNCNTIALEQAIFCHHCGYQLKCTQCQSPIIAGANNCIVCGTEVSAARSESFKTVNQIKFRENKEERWYEINFTNDVGKEIKEVVADILKNKIGKNANSPTWVDSSKKESNQFLEEETYETVGLTQDHAPIFHSPTDSHSNLETTPTYPHLNDLEIRLTCTENEWLLIFAFYKSEFGTTTFSKEPIWHLYKEKRLTETRFKNLGTNWKSLFKKYLSTVKDNEFKFTSQGLVKVKALLLSDKEKIKEKGATQNKAPQIGNGFKSGGLKGLGRKAMPHNLSLDEFDVYKNDLKISLEEFFGQKQPGTSNPNRIVCIGYYITKINYQEYFTEGNIDYAYRILNLGGKPVHLKQIIYNLKNDRIWFKKVLDGGITGWRLTRQAEIYVEEKL